MDSLNKIKALNPTLANGMIAPEEYDVLVVGRYVKDEDGKVTKIKFVERTKPSEAAKAAGVEVQQYLRASFTKSGAIIASAVKPVVEGVPAEKSYRGSKKPQVGNIFKNTQLNLYNFLMEELKAKNYTEVGDQKVIEGNKSVVRPVCRVHATVWGAKVSITVPKYKLTRKNADGKREDLTGAKYNAKSDSYDKNAGRTSITLRWWADLDDLEEIESMAVSMYERNVLPYETGETVIVETKGNTTTQTIKSEPVTPETPEVEEEVIVTDDDDENDD